MMFYLFLQTGACGEEAPIRITTWNLEHMMSEDVYTQWREFCAQEAVGWDDTEAKKQGKSPELTYCSAHSGMHWPGNGYREALSLRTRENFQEKVNALKLRAAELDSDIFAFQEVSDAAAIGRILPEDRYTVFFRKMPGIAMQVGYAVKKSLARTAAVRLIEDLAVCDVRDRIDLNNPSSCTEDSYRTRPGLELTVTIRGESVTFLNVHLKSSCRSYAVNDLPENAGKRARRGCRMLRDQIPVLESWIDSRARNNELFVLLGDFNRDFVREITKKMPARLDGSSSKDPILAQTKIGSIFKELSDNDPDGADLYFEWQKINGPWKRTCTREDGSSYKVRSCHRGIDHLLFSKSFVKVFLDNRQRVAGEGSDYGDESYCADRARPSDHCPVSLTVY